jgi:AraC-like DNA-binding protein
MPQEIDALPAPVTYTRLLLQRWPGKATAMLRETRLRAADLPGLAAITVAQQLQVFRNAMNLADRPDWALDFGRHLSISSHGPLGFAALSAPTLGAGLEVLGRFARIRAPYLGFASAQAGQQLRLTFDTGVYPLRRLELPMVEILLRIGKAYIDAVCGVDAVETTLCVALPRPRHAKLYALHFRSGPVFNAGFNGIALSAAFKDLPCPLHDEETYRASVLRCREALDAVLSPDDVLARASHWLAAHFDRIATGAKPVAQPRLEQLAAALCMSPRTASRQLSERGTSFTELRAARQHEIACRMLADARFTVNEIGLRLGYGDAANFLRAFKRVTGVPPGQYRRGQR